MTGRISTVRISTVRISTVRISTVRISRDGFLRATVGFTCAAGRDFLPDDTFRCRSVKESAGQ